MSTTPTPPTARTTGWRPPEWSKPPLTTITVPAAPVSNTAYVIHYDGEDSAGGSESGGSVPPQAAGPTVYVFDGVLKIGHARELIPTRLPIQTSASSPVSTVSDHAYQQQPQVTLDILMSDLMDSYAAGAWSGGASKSVSAYATLVALQTAKTLVTLTSRLDTYPNMLVVGIHAEDTVRTLHGLRATVVFEQLYLAGTTFSASDNTAQPISARPSLTDSTPSGTIQSVAPPATQLAPMHIPAGLQGPPGAGSYSSTSVTAAQLASAT